MKTYYQTNLPHIVPIGEVFFVTFRLVDSLPKEVIALLYEEYCFLQKNKSKIERHKQYFAKFDNYLDSNTTGNHWLKTPSVAEIVMKKLHEFDKKYYDLYAYVVMSNHVHLLVDFGKQIENLPANAVICNENYAQLDKVMNLIKGATSRYANIELGRKGKFWQKGSYDHYVRNGKELNNIISYIVNNPVKAGIVENWEDYPYIYNAFA
jgi:REP element-mobilizing transposase RayT